MLGPGLIGSILVVFHGMTFFWGPPTKIGRKINDIKGITGIKFHPTYRDFFPSLVKVMTCLPIYFRSFLGIINLIYSWIRGPPCICMLCITVSLGSVLFWAAKFSWDSTGSRQKNFTNVFKLGCEKKNGHFGSFWHNKTPEYWSPFIKYTGGPVIHPLFNGRSS